MRLYFILTVVLIAGFAACHPVPSTPSADSISERAALKSGIIDGTKVASKNPIARSTVAVASHMMGVFCTGVLIAENLVLTAAHCTDDFYPLDLSVVFGSDLSGQVTQRRVVEWRIHPSWLKGSFQKRADWGDLAVLRFEPKMPPGYVPSGLWTDEKILRRKTRITIAGYGVKQLSPKVNSKRLLQAPAQLTGAKFSDSEFVLNPYRGKVACLGDSGGPAYLAFKGRIYVLGIISRTMAKTHENICLSGSIYTSVPGSLSFISRAISELNPPPDETLKEASSESE